LFLKTPKCGNFLSFKIFKKCTPIFYSKRDNDRRVPRPHLPKKKRVFAYPDLNLMEFFGNVKYTLTQWINKFVA
jgi:hypothetical protein